MKKLLFVLLSCSLLLTGCAKEPEQEEEEVKEPEVEEVVEEEVVEKPGEHVYVDEVELYRYIYFEDKDIQIDVGETEDSAIVLINNKGQEKTFEFYAPTAARVYAFEAESGVYCVVDCKVDSGNDLNIVKIDDDMQEDKVYYNLDFVTNDPFKIPKLETGEYDEFTMYQVYQVLGTHLASNQYVFENGEFIPLNEEYQVMREHSLGNPLTSKDIEATKDGKKTTIPANTELQILGFDLKSYVKVQDNEGTVYKIPVEYITNEFGIVGCNIQGVDAHEYFERLYEAG